MAEYTLWMLIASLALLPESTEGSAITCQFPTVLVYEGDLSVTLPCFLSNIETTNAVTVLLNGVEVTQRVVLNGIYTYQDSRYIIRTSDLIDKGNESTIWYHLGISDIIRDDDGEYEFQLLSSANNPYVISSFRKSLDVYYLPVGPPTCSPGEVFVVPGNKVPLMCTSGVKLNSITFEWMFKGQDGALNGSETTQTNGIVTSVIEITSIETGFLTCTLSFNDTIFPNEAPRSCDAGPINIITNPLVLVTPTQLTVSPGENALFTCVIAGNDPIAKRIWHSEHIPSTKIFASGVDDRVVLISSVQPEDSGSITCRVSKGINSFVEDSADLIVSLRSPSTKTTIPVTTRTEHISRLDTTGNNHQTIVTNSGEKAAQDSCLIDGLGIGIWIGIAVTVVLEIIIASFVFVVIYLQNKQKQDSKNQELQSTSCKNDEKTGTSIYADLNHTEMQTSTYTELNPKVNYAF